MKKHNKSQALSDYLNDYSNGFYDYGKMFLEWTKFKGYIMMTVANQVFLFVMNKYYNNYLAQNDFNTEAFDILRQTSNKLSEAFKVIDQEDLCGGEIDKYDTEITKLFLSTLFPKAPSVEREYYNNYSDTHTIRLLKEFKIIRADNNEDITKFFRRE